MLDGIGELAFVVLRVPLEEHNLEVGDVGAVVHRYADDQPFEVEFADVHGNSIAVLTLDDAAVRSPAAGEILHVREMSTAAS